MKVTETLKGLNDLGEEINRSAQALTSTTPQVASVLSMLGYNVANFARKLGMDYVNDILAGKTPSARAVNLMHLANLHKEFPYPDPVVEERTPKDFYNFAYNYPKTELDTAISPEASPTFERFHHQRMWPLLSRFLQGTLKLPENVTLKEGSLVFEFGHPLGAFKSTAEIPLHYKNWMSLETYAVYEDETITLERRGIGFNWVWENVLEPLHRLNEVLPSEFENVDLADAIAVIRQYTLEERYNGYLPVPMTIEAPNGDSLRFEITFYRALGLTEEVPVAKVELYGNSLHWFGYKGPVYGHTHCDWADLPPYVQQKIIDYLPGHLEPLISKD